MSRPSPQRTMEGRQVQWLAIMFFLFMLVLAFIPAIRSVSGLPWGSVIDFHRDESFVRALLEGHYGEDPTYLGDHLWYPPLLTWIESALVAIAGLPPSTIIVQMGPYANLLAPITFFLMAWYFLGAGHAALSTAAYLFFSVGQEPGYAIATYSPRLIPVSFGQVFFYLEIILVDRAFRSTRLMPSLWAGAGAGIAFLAHPAPALIAVLIFAGYTAVDVIRAFRQGDKAHIRRRISASFLAGAAFLVTTLPITWYIIGHYGMHTINRAGFLFTYYALTLHDLGLFLNYNLTFFSIIALLGAWLVWRRQGQDTMAPGSRRMLLSWLLISLVLFAYSYTVSVLDKHAGLSLPGTVPTFHFFFYMKATMALFAGIAGWELFAWAWRLVTRTSSCTPLALQPKPALVLFSITALACTLNYPSYATRRDVRLSHNRDRAFLENNPGIEVAETLGTLLPWGAVVLCEIKHSGWPVLPTARHVVATESTFGNPYVDQRQRETDNALLLQGMRAPRGDTRGLLEQYGVTNLLVSPEELEQMPLAHGWFPQQVFRNDGFVLLGR